MQTIEIAGRKFKGVAGSTMENDMFNQGMIAKAGLTQLKMDPTETPDAFALRVCQTMAGNTDIFLLLGGMIIPAEVEPTDWSEALATQTAQFLRKCTDPADKKIIQGQISAAIVGFIRAELISISFIQKYLSKGEKVLLRPSVVDALSGTGLDS